MKTCSKCDKSKSLEEFSLKNKNTGLRSSWCKACNREYQKNHYKLNKEMYREKARQWEEANGGASGKRLRNYSLTREQYNSMLTKYEGKCWICREASAIHIDHDHSCCSGPSSCGNCVRGLLCGFCNTMLGRAKDSKEFFSRAITYLT